MSLTPSVLIVCSDSIQSAAVADVVRHLALQPVMCSSLTDARRLTERETFQFVLCGDDLPDCNLRTAVRVLSSSAGRIPVIVISHLADCDTWLRALNAGAFDFISCPPDPREAERILRLALMQNPPPQRASQTAA